MSHYTLDDIENAKSFFKNFRDKKFRDYQAEAIRFIVNSEKPVVALRAPTGSGKTLIAMCVIKLIGDGIYLAHSKALQDQSVNDFPEFRILKGRANYPCALYSKLQADECPFRNPKQCKYSVNGECEHRLCYIEQKRAGNSVPCVGTDNKCEFYVAKCEHNCPYIVQKRKVDQHPLRILNYQYFILATNYGKAFSGKEIVVCDEADKLDDILLSFVSLAISDRDIHQYKLPNPHTLYKTPCENGIKSWKIWAGKSAGIMKKRIDKIPDDAKRSMLENAEGFKNKLDKFIKLVDETWRLSVGRNRYGEFWLFKPVWITPEMTDEYFRNHVGGESGGKLVMMSATLKALPALSQETGIPMSEMDFMETPSLFDPQKCPIYLDPVTAMSKEARKDKDEMQKIVDKILDILNKHKDEKGLIHTKNYEITKFIMDNCNRSGRLITHKTKNRGQVLNNFINATEPLVLVSPSMGRGISLEDDRCRFQIISKVPFPDLGDQQINARLFGSGNMGRYWYRASTANAVEQSIGRGIRNEDDWCTTYIIDANAESLIAKHRNMFSKHFFKCLIW